MYRNEGKSAAIVVDSAASLPAGMVGQDGLYAVPLTLTLGDVSYRDGVDITPTEFYRMLRESSSLPTTSAPPSARYIETFQEAASRYGAILCITTGGRFSASLDAAAVAAQEVQQSLPGVDIRVVDSEAAAGSQGLAALTGWRCVQRGASVQDAEDEVRMVIGRVRLLAFVDTLRYLRRGGRVPHLAHVGASLLRIKPLFELANGEVNTLARPRTRRIAIGRMMELVGERATAGAMHATVMHADAAEDAEEVRSGIEAGFQCAELFVSEFTPVMGAHIGPGVLGIAFWCED